MDTETKLLKMLGPAPISRPRDPIKVTIVCGPPGSGKTDYLEQRWRRGDLVVDMDRLYTALSMLSERDKPSALLPFVCEARDAVIARIEQGAPGIAQAWILTTSNDWEFLVALGERLRARAVVLNVPTAECRRRMIEQGRDAEHIRQMVQRCHEWHQGGPINFSRS